MKKTDLLSHIFADNLRERRKKTGMTQKEFARSIGMSSSFITEIETYRKSPSFAMIECIANKLGIPAWTLFCEDGYKFDRGQERNDELAARLKEKVGEVIDKTLNEES